MGARSKVCPECQTTMIERRAKRCRPCVERTHTGPTPQPPMTNFEDAWKVWKTSVGMVKDRRKRWGHPPTKNRERILVIPDIHAPFHEPDMLAQCLSEEADRAVVMGDVSDCYSLSRFVKYEPISFSEEWAKVTLVMQEIANRYPRVDLIIGNHDVRLERQLRQRLDVDMMGAIEYMTGGILSPLVALAKRYDNITIAHHQVGDHTINWFTTVGDAWFGHPEKFSKVPGSALRTVEEWLSDNAGHMGLSTDFRLYVLAHTHQLSMFPWRSDKMLVECGCLCKTQGYMTEPNIGGRPQRRGYVTFDQVGGKTLLNSLQIHWLDVT